MQRIRGSIMILVAVIMLSFVLLTALTVDLGRLYVIRNQLQNAADAIALKAAGSLYPANALGVPNWALAATSGTSGIPLNTVNGVTLANATITTGYWDLTGVTTTLKATSIVPGASDVAAVKVTVAKTTGQNGGPITLFFGTALGVAPVSVSATAVAAAGAPSSANQNTLFPIAMSLSTYLTYWDSVNNVPLKDPLTGQPYTFHISEGVQGGWTSFKLNTNDTNSVINLITNGNPVPIKVGDLIWMTNGMKTAIYSSVPTNKDVIVPIVAASVAGQLEAVVGFGAVHIDFGLGGSSKYVQLHFTTNVQLFQGTLGGPRFGVYMPPSLVK